MIAPLVLAALVALAVLLLWLEARHRRQLPTRGVAPALPHLWCMGCFTYHWPNEHLPRREVEERALERWHELHDEYVRDFGDEARPQAVQVADVGGRVTPWGETIVPSANFLAWLEAGS